MLSKDRIRQALLEGEYQIDPKSICICEVGKVGEVGNNNIQITYNHNCRINDILSVDDEYIAIKEIYGYIMLTSIITEAEFIQYLIKANMIF